MLRILLAAAADVNQAAQGVSPLWMASRAGHVESVEVLLQLADKERADCDGISYELNCRTLFLLTCLSGVTCLTCLSSVLSQNPVLRQDATVDRLLRWAC